VEEASHAGSVRDSNHRSQIGETAAFFVEKQAKLADNAESRDAAALKAPSASLTNARKEVARMADGQHTTTLWRRL
jgi:hypothetical protein